MLRSLRLQSVLLVLYQSYIGLFHLSNQLVALDQTENMAPFGSSSILILKFCCTLLAFTAIFGVLPGDLPEHQATHLAQSWHVSRSVRELGCQMVLLRLEGGTLALSLEADCSR